MRAQAIMWFLIGAFCFACWEKWAVNNAVQEELQHCIRGWMNLGMKGAEAKTYCGWLGDKEP